LWVKVEGVCTLPHISVACDHIGFKALSASLGELRLELMGYAILRQLEIEHHANLGASIRQDKPRLGRVLGCFNTFFLHHSRLDR